MERIVSDSFDTAEEEITLCSRSNSIPRMICWNVKIKDRKIK
jgi:hypothetical protein